MKIAIGPIEGHYGGAAQHILNIVEYSKHQYDLIEVPETLQKWSKFFREHILPIQRKFPHSIKHSDKRFDMLGWQKYIDLPGIIKSKFGLRNYDAVHLHGHPWWEQIYNVNNPNVIYTVHNLYNPDDFSPGRWKLIEILNAKMIKICRRSKKVISVAKWLQKALVEKYGIDSIYIPNGVNLREFNERNGKDFRRKYGIDDDFYLFVGRATKYKRPELFVELAKEFPRRRFIMVGRGLTREKFQEYSQQRLPENLILIGEPERKDVIDAFDACRVFVLPSSNETFGIVILEAMASCKPVVAADHLGPSEIIKDGKIGFLFKPDNLESLVLKADIAWNSSWIGMAAREEVEKNYDWKNIVPKIEEVYES